MKLYGGWTVTDPWNWTFAFGLTASRNSEGDRYLTLYVGPFVLFAVWPT